MNISLLPLFYWV